MPTYQAADGVSLYYDVLGDGGPIITLAGGAARHPDYLGDLAGLSGLVVPHLRGVGKSPADGAAAFWEQAADIEALREHLGLERLVIVGHSAGTRLAIAYAAQYPARVERMLLVTPPAAYLVDVPSDAEELIDARRGDPAVDKALAAEMDMSTEDAYNAWTRTVAPLGYAAWTEVEQRHAEVGRFHLAAAQAFFSSEPPADLADRLKAVTAPALIVAGAQDCLTGFAPVVALADLLPNGDVAVIEKCGHYPWVEQPEQFRAIADRFLSGSPAPGSA